MFSQRNVRDRVWRNAGIHVAVVVMFGELLEYMLLL